MFNRHICRPITSNASKRNGESHHPANIRGKCFGTYSDMHVCFFVSQMLRILLANLFQENQQSCRHGRRRNLKVKYAFTTREHF